MLKKILATKYLSTIDNSFQFLQFPISAFCHRICHYNGNALHYLVTFVPLCIGFQSGDAFSMHMNFPKMIKCDVLRNRNSRRAFYVWLSVFTEGQQWNVMLGDEILLLDLQFQHVTLYKSKLKKSQSFLYITSKNRRS